MTIEEGEALFGKRWNAWTEAEQREFCSVLEPGNVHNPGCLAMACRYPRSVSDEVRRYLIGVNERFALLWLAAGHGLAANG